jgi:hypothetical protein
LKRNTPPSFRSGSCTIHEAARGTLKLEGSRAARPLTSPRPRYLHSLPYAKGHNRVLRKSCESTVQAIKGRKAQTKLKKPNIGLCLEFLRPPRPPRPKYEILTYYTGLCVQIWLTGPRRRQAEPPQLRKVRPGGSQALQQLQSAPGKHLHSPRRSGPGL